MPLSFDIGLEVLVQQLGKEEKIKSSKFEKTEAKLSLFADDMVPYIEKPQNCEKTIRTNRQIHCS